MSGGADFAAPLHHRDGRGQAHRRPRHEIHRPGAHRPRQLRALFGGADPYDWGRAGEKRQRGLERLPPSAPRPVDFSVHPRQRPLFRQDDRGRLLAQNPPRAGDSVRVRDPEVSPPALQLVPGFRAKILPAAEQHQLSPSPRRAFLSRGG
jgi:hypothetical protein